MLSILTPGVEKFSNNKCGEVYCETPTTYNVSCCVCDKKLPLHQFPQHFQNLHLGPEKNNDLTKIKVEDPQVDLDARQLTPVDDIDINSEFNNSDGYSSEEELPIEFMEVQLPKLKSNKFNDFIPEHVTMDFACFEDSMNQHQYFNLDESITNSKIQEKKQPSKKIAAKCCKVEDNKAHLQNKTERLQSKTTPIKNEIPKDDQKTEQSTEVNADKDECVKDASNDVSDVTDVEQCKIQKLEDFFCSFCSRYYKSKRGLQHHIRIVHNSATQTKKEYIEPISMEKPTSYVCNICGKKFSCLGNMNTHKKRHTGVKSYQCPECGNFYHTDHEMKSHLMRHTDHLPVICEICGRGFRNTGKLKAHMRRHTGERPAKCEVCGKCFFSFHDLNVHRVTHTNERPFACEVCGSTFRTKKALRVHKKLHITERAHECKLCGKAFLKESGLISHVQQVHMKNVP